MMHYITAMTRVDTTMAIACRCGKLIVVYASSVDMREGWQQHLNDIDRTAEFMGMVK
jgi:hypothetical protein